MRNTFAILALCILACNGEYREPTDAMDQQDSTSEEYIPKAKEEPEDWQLMRSAQFLAWSCSHPLNPRDPMHLIAHLACHERLGYPDITADIVPWDAFDKVFEKMYQLKDTSDFDAMRLVDLLYATRGHPVLPQSLRGRIEDALLSFKYWFSDPTPIREVGGKQVRDLMWYWSENHILVFRATEYLAGQLLPDRTFVVTGKNGEWHRERAKTEILRWLDERSKMGFVEWHSDVYYNWDMIPLISLVEWAQDEEVVQRSAMVLDLLLLDMALHMHKGNFGVTHGRSYIKDKAAAMLEDTYDAAKLLFDQTQKPWHGVASTAAVLLARSERYAMPYAIKAVSQYGTPFEDRERIGLPIPEEAPENPFDPVPSPPYGLAWDEAHLSLWWSMGAFTTWPLLPLTLEVATRYNLWEAQFEPISVLSDLLDLSQPVSLLIEQIHPLYRQFYRMINAGLLKEAFTKTYKTANCMLSSVQDYRKGSVAMQVHSWQATLSEDALVFTQHPGALPVPEQTGAPTGWDWQASDEHGKGYWTGESSMPRIAQHKDIAVILYAPQYPKRPLGLAQFDYRDETHAYFPVAHFDEVVRRDHWTFGRKDRGYVALWSYRPLKWRDGQPEVYDNKGQPFDLVAEGGAENTFVVQIGDEDEWGSFSAFIESLSSSTIVAEHVADKGGDGLDDGFRVEWDAPKRGKVSFGWDEPFIVSGVEVPLSWEWRFDNPFVRTSFYENRYDVTIGEDRLLLDFGSGERLATRAPFIPYDWCNGKRPEPSCYRERRSGENIELAKEIADRYLGLYPAPYLAWSWETTVLMNGVYELYRVTGDEQYLKYMRDWIDTNIESGYLMWSSDSMSPAQIAAYLFIETGDSKYKVVVEDAFHYLDEVATRTEDGGINHWGVATFPGATLWLDSLFMFGTLLTRWGEFMSDPSRLDQMGEQFEIFTKHLQAENGLYVHAYGYNKPVDKDIFWGRGNGWVAAAGFDYLRARRNRGEQDETVSSALKRQVQAIIEMRDPDTGMWWTVLNRPGESYLETSCTALFAYALARGWRYGLLGNEILPVVARAMDGVKASLTRDEKGQPVVSQVSVPTEAGTFEYYKSLPVADDLGYGVGAVLLALVETSGIPLPPRGTFPQ